VDVRYDEKSKTAYTKINFTAAFTKPVQKAMEWGDPPPGYAGSDLDGAYAAQHFVLTPGAGLEKHEIQLTANEMAGFSLARVTDSDGESTKWELRFQIVSADAKAASELHKYLKTIGKGEASLAVTYEAQSALEEEEQQQRLINEEQAADTAEATDEVPAKKTAKARG
jgi:hypothetical protein